MPNPSLALRVCVVRTLSASGKVFQRRGGRRKILVLLHCGAGAARIAWFLEAQALRRLHTDFTFAILQPAKARHGPTLLATQCCTRGRAGLSAVGRRPVVVSPGVISRRRAY